MMTVEEKRNLHGISYHFEDDGSFTYCREDGKPLTPENEAAVKKFIQHVKLVEGCVIAEGGDPNSPDAKRLRTQMAFEIAMDALGGLRGTNYRIGR